MTRIDINNTHHQVVVEGEGSPQALANLAVRVYKETYNRDNNLASGGLGFTSEKRYEFDLSSLEIK